MLQKFILIIALAVLPYATNAAVIKYEIDVNTAPTDYEVTLSAPQFDDLEGTRILNSVTLTIDGDVSGSASVESLDPSAQTIIVTLAAELTLFDTLSNVLVMANPSITNTFNATAYDGITDFGGSSGITYTDLFANNVMSQMYTNEDILAYFSGNEVASLIFSANNVSFASGAGGFPSAFDTNAAGRIILEYSYTDVVDATAPASFVLMSLGVLGFGVFRKFVK